MDYERLEEDNAAEERARGHVPQNKAEMKAQGRRQQPGVPLQHTDNGNKDEEKGKPEIKRNA